MQRDRCIECRMVFRAERVQQAQCPHCGRDVDVSQATALRTIPCPHCRSEMTVPARVGSMLVTRLIGQGTGSVVYAARDRVLGRDVALKVLRPRDDKKPGQQNGVEEARSLLLLNHPNVIKVYAIDTRRGQPCIIMELLSGGSLKDTIQQGEMLDEQRAVQIALDVARGLHETSSRGLLHLDVKPGNIMFDAEGRAKLLDFGFAGLDLDASPSEIIGTPYYVSPELVRQESPDLRADIYSLGATLYHALAGRPPFDDESLRTLIVARLKEPPPDLRACRPDLHKLTSIIIHRMMAREVEGRYSDYESLIEHLTALRDELAGVTS